MQDIENEAGVAPVTEGAAPEPRDGGEIRKEEQAANQAPVSPEIETRAREMGWKPQTEWGGPVDKWRPADEYVRRGEEVLGIVRKNLDRERVERSKDRERFEGELARRDEDWAARFKRLEGMSQIALQRQREQIWAQFEVEKRRAAETGDVDGYDKLSRDQIEAMRGFQTEFEEEPEQKPRPAPKSERPAQAAVPAEIAETVESWKAKNAWFSADPVMNAAAQAFHMKLLREKPGLSVSDNLEETARFIRSRFADAFGPPSRQDAPHAPAVEGGARQANGGPRAKGWNELPPEAKQAAERNIRDKLYTNDAKGRAEFAADYWSQF